MSAEEKAEQAPNKGYSEFDMMSFAWFCNDDLSEARIKDLKELLDKWKLLNNRV